MAAKKGENAILTKNEERGTPENRGTQKEDEETRG
jgi:hypothetical protein